MFINMNKNFKLRKSFQFDTIMQAYVTLLFWFEFCVLLNKLVLNTTLYNMHVPKYFQMHEVPSPGSIILCF